MTSYQDVSISFKFPYLVSCSLLSLIDFMLILIWFLSYLEYKKAKQELKKATAETSKWQKKVKKGELGEQSLWTQFNVMVLACPVCNGWALYAQAKDRKLEYSFVFNMLNWSPRWLIDSCRVSHKVNVMPALTYDPQHNFSQKVEDAFLGLFNLNSFVVCFAVRSLYFNFNVCWFICVFFSHFLWFL